MKPIKNFKYLKAWKCPTEKEVVKAQNRVILIMNGVDVPGVFRIEYGYDGGPTDLWLSVYTTLKTSKQCSDMWNVLYNKFNEEPMFDPANGGGWHCNFHVIRISDVKKHYRDIYDEMVDRKII